MNEIDEIIGRVARSILKEDRVSDLKSRYPHLSADIQRIADADPSQKKQKYLEYATKVLASHQAPVEEIIDVIRLFHRYVNRLTQKDINQWDFTQLRDNLFRLSNSGDSLSNREKRELASEGAEKIFEDPRAFVYHIDTKAASCQYGKGTKWCITMANYKYYESYKSANVVFYFMVSKELDEKNKYHKVAFAYQRDLNNKVLRVDVFDAEDRQPTKEELYENLGEDLVNRASAAMGQDVKKRSVNMEFLLKKATNVNQFKWEDLKKHIVTIAKVRSNILNTIPPKQVPELQQRIVHSNDADAILNFAREIPKERGADVKALQAAMEKVGDGQHLLDFVLDVPGSDHKSIEAAALKQNDVGVLLELARFVKGVDIKKIEDAVINSGEAWALLSLASDVASSDLDRLYAAAKKLGDEEVVSMFDQEMPELQALHARVPQPRHESLRSIYGVSQPNLTGGSRGVGGEIRRGGGRGTPGYPVPPEMEDGDEERFPFMKEGEAPLAKSPVMDDPGKDPNKGFSEWGDELTEAETPKGIAHLEDLSPEAFLRFLERYRDMPLKGGLEVSEKVDGSARMTFGIENGKIWTQSKNGPRYASSDRYPNKPMFAALKAAARALESKAPQIVKAWPEGVESMVAEVLYTKVPNVIEYGPNVIIVHGGVEQAQVEPVIRATGGKLTDGKDEWKFEFKRVVRPEDVMVDVHEEFESLGQIYSELKRAQSKGETAAVQTRFKAVQVALKKKLVGQLRKQRSVYGPEGGDVEGLVFRDLESGALTKLVDRDYFTELNKFMWYYRELLGRGVKVGDDWVPGIGARLRAYLSDEVLGTKATKSPAFVSNLKKKYGAPSTQEEADSLLARYVQENNLMRGDFLASFRDVLERTRTELGVVWSQWEEARKGDIEFVSRDGRRRKMDDLVKRRTDNAFEEAEGSLDGMERAIETVAQIHDPLTRKVATLKVVLGRHGMEKLVGGTEKEEALVREAAPPPIPYSQRKIPRDAHGNVVGVKEDQARQVLQQNSQRLQKKGIDVKALRPVGEGSRGVAFQTPDGKVLKVTNDVAEAVAANKLKGMGLKHVVQFYDVFRFPQGELYGVVQEKLEPLEKKEANQLNFALWDPETWGKGTEIPQLIVKAGYDWGKVRDMAIQHTQDHARQETDPAKQKEILEQANTYWKRLTQVFHIGDMAKELFSQGIRFHDYHAGNVMKRANGDYVLIDIGMSKISGGKEPPVLERLIREITSLVEAPPNRLAAIKAAANGKEARRSSSISDVVREALPLLQKKRYVPKKVLGHGAHGIAYDIGGNRVLKATDDELEAKASNHIRGKKLRHVVNVYDIFQFPGSKFYGIVQEKLRPMSDYDKRWFEVLTDLLQAAKCGEAILSGDYGKVLAQVKANIQDPDVQKGLDDQMREYQLPEIFRELHDNRIEFLDYHSENLMMRGKDYVVIDLGLSQSPGAAPPVLEEVIRQVFLEFSGHERVHGLGPVGRAEDLEETESQEYVGVDSNIVNHQEDGTLDRYSRNISEGFIDTVGVTVGRYQPFHRGHAEVIRQLARTHTKVIVLVAGNTPDKKNPFSYETRVRMMKESLPDVWRKIEVYKATFGGKNSGYVPGVLSDIVKKGSPSLKGDTAAEVLVGPDRFAQMQQQLDRARQYKKDGGESAFDPDLAVVKELPGVKNDDDTDRVSGTRLRMAIAKDDRETAKKMLDPHLVSNPDQFEDTFVRLKKEMGVHESIIREDLEDIGEEGVTGVLQTHRQALAGKGVQVDRLRKLGAGQAGVAYDMGGGKVFKVTTSANEGKSSMALKGKNLRHVVRIFDVFRMTDRRQDKVPVIGIVRENLQPLPQNEAAELNDLVDLIRDDQVIQTTIHGDFEKTMQAVRSLMTKEIRRDLSLPETPPQDPAQVQGNKRELRAKALVDSKMQELEGRLRHYQIPEMMKDLRSVGVQFADYKGDNIMKRGSDYVLSDPGGKTTSADPPVLEAIVEAVMNEIGVTFNSNAPGATQAGVRAGSSGWSSPQGMYNDDDVEAAEEDPDSFELWSDNLRNVPTARAIGEAVVGMLVETEPDPSSAPKVTRTFGATEKKPKPKRKGEWIPWSSTSKDVPFKDSERGTGPGEMKVARELDLEKERGKGNVEYDLFDPKHPRDRWEVKALDNSSVTGMLGVFGRKAVVPMVREWQRATEQLGRFLDNLQDEGRVLVRQDFGFDVERVEQWYLHNEEYIMNGELVKSRLLGDDGFEGILRLVQKYLAHPAHEKVPLRKLGLGDKKTDVSIDQYVQIMMDVLGRPREEIDAGVVDIARAQLKHPLFRHPERLKPAWEGAQPSRMVPDDVSGMILVHPSKGFMIVPKDQMDKILQLHQVTKNTPKLSLKYSE